MDFRRILADGRPVRFALGAAALCSGLVLGGPARAGIDVHVDIGNAPPPPVVVFHRAPRRVLEPTSQVYVIDDPDVGDNDCFYYGGYYWLFADGYWYRKTSWRGRFVVVQPRYVPARLYRVPEGRWKHGPNGPPGLSRKPGGMPPGQYKKMHGDDDDQGRGHGKGHGKDR